jgi:hypothetical protein
LCFKWEEQLGRTDDFKGTIPSGIPFDSLKSGIGLWHFYFFLASLKSATLGMTAAKTVAERKGIGAIGNLYLFHQAFAYTVMDMPCSTDGSVGKH